MALGPVTPPPELLPGMPPRPAQHFEPLVLTDKMAFGAIPKYFAGSGEIGSFTEQASTDVMSSHLERILLLGKGNYAVGQLSLDASEYNKVVRSPRGLVKHLGATSVAASDKKQDSNAERIAERERQNILDGIIQKGIVHNTMIAATQLEINNLSELLKCIAKPGRAMINAQDLISLAAQARDTYFANMLRVVERAQEWDNKRIAAANNAMQYRLTQGPQHERVQYWHEMAELAKKYATARKLLFEDRRNKLRERWRETNSSTPKQQSIVEDSSVATPEVQ